MRIHDWTRVDAGVFHDFHVVWIGRLKSLLNEELLPRPFYAMAEQFLGSAEPDVIALEASADPTTPSPAYEPKRLRSDSTEGAVALAGPSVVVEEFVPDRYARKTRRLVIKDAFQGDQVVAVVEIVSKGSKTPTARVDQFVSKAVGLLDQGIHLVVIDLQAPTPLVPRGFHVKVSTAFGHESTTSPADEPLSAVSYQILETGAVRAHLVNLQVGDELPDLAVFLTPHEFVLLPLGRTYAEAFRSVPWRFQELLETE